MTDAITTQESAKFVRLISIIVRFLCLEESGQDLFFNSKRGLLIASFGFLRFWTNLCDSNSTQKPTPIDVSVNELLLESQ